MTSGRAGGLKIREPLKADSSCGPPEGGLRSDARPGGKDFLCKNHEAACILWARRANRFNLR
jgi:hypothetical protein